MIASKQVRPPNRLDKKARMRIFYGSWIDSETSQASSDSILVPIAQVSAYGILFTRYGPLISTSFITHTVILDKNVYLAHLER